jgi:hypothetical protein
VRVSLRSSRSELVLAHVTGQPAEELGSGWLTDERDYPPEKLTYLEKTPTDCRCQAAELGSHVADGTCRRAVWVSVTIATTA